ncbi:DNA translocase FtsK [Clostridium botulinum C]|uniref:DNA translocase FtsK n=2 Tax=Clostridium botulinum TaxID=1491 RepID=A0A9Q4TLH4_CLOBO|nr:DNA translocase FtsK [Clostridium botulinum]MCD3194334.1 DNA translocase FtsK [Clostridium botulinum C]MCD3199488.1 DNA translocase FtsK [Clostridium botulinum C]MCD3204963.1 DNA translocase FtsK [Clostridium botulinum C]MCD3207781.1 DNA translocase FtsK [Clostridium botulinum C]MCD3225246.1 DNA translocase FtsK [Clostridium botulinum C]
MPLAKKNKHSKKASKTVQSSQMPNDIKGIIFITLGILMILSVFASDSSGILGKSIKKLLIGLFGMGSYIFPLLMIFIGISYILKNGKITFNNRFYGIFIFILNTLLFTQMIYINDYYIEDNFIEGIKKIFIETSVIHGGIIGYIMDVPLYKLLGSVGSYIVFISIYIISVIYVMQISLGELLIMIKGSAIQKRKFRNTLRDKDIIYDDEKDTSSSFIKGLNDKIKFVNFLKSTEDIDTNREEIIDNEKDYRKSQMDEPKIVPNIVDNKPTNNTQMFNKADNTRRSYVKEEPNNFINDEIQQKSNEIRSEYIFPSTELLNRNINNGYDKNGKRELINYASKLEETLNSFGVNAKVIQVTKGPSVTRFELQPSAGVKVSKITHLSDDIALSLAASSVRIEAPIPGKSAIGIEVPNKVVSAVYLSEVIESNEFKNFNKNIAFAVGKDISGKCVVADLSKMPHLLIAGATGSGKSVCINTLIISLIYKYSPEDVKLLLVDPKVVELNIYNDIPHLLIPVVTNPKKAAGALNWAVTEMTRRYNLFAENNVRNIEGYNELVKKGRLSEKLPWIVIIIDELADLMMVSPGEVEEYIARLAQMARAAGMHLVIATQRPSVDVITGVIKANIPSRISFAVSSQIDSRTIIDSAGAEKLLGKGDMLFYPVGESKPVRIQGAFISEEEVENIVNFIKDQKGPVEYQENIINDINTKVEKQNSDSDELLDEAIEIAMENGQISTSLLQRRLKIGYNRAARIIDDMEGKGIISGKNGSKPRQILLDNEDIKNNS